MNWTEGTLNRHSRGRKGKETILRQKQHFAKARTGLLNANAKTSPPSISFLTHPALSSSTVRRASSKSASSSSKNRSDALASSRYFSEANVKLPNPATFRRQQAGEETLRHERRRLLLKGDWVGTNMQKPIEMNFSRSRASPSHAWDARLARHESSRHRLRQLLGVRLDNGRSKTPQSGVMASTPISLRKMRIRVGSRERTLGGSSDISRSYKGGRSSFHAGHGSGSRTPRGEWRTRDDVSMSDSDARSHQSSSDPGQTNRLSTSPSLFHPVPTRPGLLRLLSAHSVDSDNAESTSAQLGIQRPLIPSDQVEENETWRTFVAGSGGLQSSTDFPTFGDERITFERLVSPGVSQMGQTEPPRATAQDLLTYAPILEHNEVDEDMEGEPSSRPFMDLRSDQFGISGSETPSDDGQVDPTMNGPSSKVSDNSLAQASEECLANKGGKQRSRSESSDEVSLLVVPSSPAPSSSNVPRYDIVLQTLQTGPTSPQAISRTAQPTGRQKPEDTSDSQGITHTVGRPRQGTPEDGNGMWRKFVYGDSDENLEQALEDARKETARNLRPSVTSSSICDEVSGPDTHSYEDLHQGSMSSFEPAFEVDRHDSAHDSQHFAAISSTTASASRVATAGASSPVLTSEFQYSETTMPTDQATAGSSSSSLLAQTDLVDGPLNLMAAETTTTVPDELPLTVQPHQLEKQDESDEGFKFARPKLFMGKKLGPVDEVRQIALSTAQIRGRYQTRRRSIRTSDGRANIRKLPNYGSDPIEEFEDGARSDRARQGSIFGSLETEEST